MGRTIFGRLDGQVVGGVDEVIPLRLVFGEVRLVGIRDASLELMEGVRLRGVLIGHIRVGRPRRCKAGNPGRPRR